MPQLVYCNGCDAVLYQGDALKSPEEILQKYEEKCPKCGVKLSLTPKKIEVKPAKKGLIGRRNG